MGIGCRFPGGVDGPATYWDLLSTGRDALVDIPPERWQVDKFYAPDLVAGTSRVRRGGFLSQPIDRFDAGFFGISPREAAQIDPQQRLLLEVAWEAFEDAGATLEQLAGSPTGVFVGGFTLDYSQIQFAGMERGWTDVAAHTATGVVMTMLANRISHAFDLMGPSMAVDTACSSSLVAVHLACRSLWSGESAIALAGGVNLMLTPNFTIAASQGGFLSPTSRTRTFDADADGYVRGEGAGIVVLKPLADATRDGDRVYAVIRGTAVTQDGRTNGITVPNGASQKRAMLGALESAGVDPSSIAFVEAHGTGTPVGDPIEANAIGDVYGPSRSPEDRCLVASVKTNIGHLEAAAGVAGLIKAALCLTHREVAPHLHLEHLNPQIDLDRLGIRIPATRETLTERDGVVRAAVNSFGFGGTNAHAVLESAPAPCGPAGVGRDDPGRQADQAASLTADRRQARPSAPVVNVFPLTARSHGALGDLAGRYVEALERGDDPGALAAATAHRRTHHPQARLAVVTDDHAELRDALCSVRDGQPHLAVHLSAGLATPSPLAFVFTGMGAQWWGMGRQLLAGNRVFREAIERCDAALAPLAGWSLVDELRADKSASRMRQTAISQPANFALQVALTDLWSSLGVAPDAIIGHSAGEIAAAYAAGALTFDDAVTVIYHRARLQQRTSGQGRLIAAAISEDRAHELAAVLDGRVGVAAVNSPESVALVGSVAALEEVKASLDEDGIFCAFVDGDVPFHSPAMDPLQDELRACLAGVQPLTPATALYSSVTGAAVTTPVHDPEYWWRNVRSSIRFSDAALAMIDDGVTAFVEIGPHPVLAHSLGECLRARSTSGFALPSLRRQDDDGWTVAHTCAGLYVAGHLPDWRAFYPQDVFHPLPAYPWQRQRYWKEADETRRYRLGELDHSLLGNRQDTPTPTWRRQLDGSRPAYLADHRIMGATVFPGAAYVEMALAAGRAAFGASRCVLDAIRFDAPAVLESGGYVLDTTLDRNSGAVQIDGRQPSGHEWLRHASARLGPAAVHAQVVDLDAARARCREERDSIRCYEAFGERGFEYGPCFRSIDHMWLGEREAVCHFAPEAITRSSDEDLVLDPIILDGCFQLLLPLAASQAGSTDMLLPIGADKIVVHGRPAADLWAHATATEVSDDELAGDVILVDAEGRAIVEVRGFRVRVVGSGHHVAPRLGTRWLHEVVWEPQEAPPELDGSSEPGTWLVLGGAALADGLRDRLEHLGHTVIVARCAAAFRALGPAELEARLDEREDVEALVRAVASANGPLRGVVHAWSAEAPADDLAAGTRSYAMHGGPLSILHLVQTLEAQSLAWPITLVTVGAQQVDGHIAAAGLSQAPLLGMCRVLHHESLSLGARIMDLDGDRPLDDVPALVAELLSPSEDQVAWRDGERKVPRLQPSQRASGSLPVTLRPDASYLITGGLGALGLLFARWMAARGARRIILVDQLEPPPRHAWADVPGGDPARARLDAIMEIERLGAIIETTSLDVADPAALQAFLDVRRADALAPVRGVIHAAGMVQDQVMVKMDQDQLETVLRPKILGAWALHETLAHTPLDFFVLFSSVSSVLAMTGQGNYAAGNAFLDALAHYRRERGLPALSVNWGPWDTGMIATLGLQPLYERRGIDLVPESVGVDILEQLLGSPETQQVVLSASWPTLIASYPIVPQLIEHLGQAAADLAAAGGEAAVSVAERLAAATADERPAIVADACAETVAGVLHVPVADLPRDAQLNHLGLDSMLAVEVRIRLEQTLGAAPNVVFLLQGATVAHIAEHIHLELTALQDEAAQPSSAEDLAALLDELDADTVEALLAAVELPVIEGSPT